MSQLTEHLCNIRREQIEAFDLLPPQQFESWIVKAEDRLKLIKASKPLPGTDDHIEAENLITNLDDFQQRRAELIWTLAYDQAGDTNLMTEHEADIYQDLLGYASDLKGGDA
ncbi:MAG: hypothetical protein LUQ50_06805 [Methanospirillum sp.]|uniref:hypothetical protein n=1 Tax=Methanospirillum sp. TaxID=45200 RepID=UPI0023751734|nr:hypothetical protein [Methanospirillum sp.]MDD1728764.1 hypothetical protein [Methanospirillum sp.]